MDDSLLALLGENGDQVFHLSDEIYAEELQMQEVIQASLIVSTAIPDGDVRSEISTSNTGDSSRSFCEICTERKETNEMFRSETCNRSFCSECIRSHGKTEMKEYSVLRSDLNCAAPMGSEHVQLIVPEKEIAPWEVALCEATVLPAEKFYCPFKDCSALLVNDAAAGEVIKESECPECRRLFCARCVVPWHAGLQCEELPVQEAIQASPIDSMEILDGDVPSEISKSNTQTGDSSRSFCEICTERKEKNEMFRSETCNRSFCSQCIRSHGKMEINEYSVLRSDLNCGAPIGPELVRRIVPEKEITRWEVALCEVTVLPAEKFHCPFKECSALLVNDAAAGEVIKESECPECRRLFCARCVVPWHAGLECEELPVQEVIQPSLIDSMEIPDGDVPSEISKSNTQSGDSSRSFCEICTERKEKNEMFRSETCNHSFCSQCIRSHVVVKLEMNVYSVLCPDLNCGASIGPEHVRRIVPEKEIDRWEVALCEATVLPEEKFYCPFKDCSTLLVNDAAAGEVIKESECPICRRLFCAQCVMPWHAGLECEEVGKLGKDEREREDLMVRALAKDRKWMSCPNCKAIVERTQGCIHMTCRCKFEFCHVCGSKWDETHWGTCQRT